jgi:hypothetical protein
MRLPATILAACLAFPALADPDVVLLSDLPPDVQEVIIGDPTQVMEDLRKAVAAELERRKKKGE